LVVAIFVGIFARSSATTYEFSISPGTQQAVAEGRTPLNPLPLALSVEVGDTLKVTNNDTAPHTYTFLVLRPGETGTYTFRRAGVFKAACTVGEHDEVVITVK
jgi:plastocyanin